MAMDRAPNFPAQVFLVLFPAAVGCLLGSLVIGSTLAAGGFGTSVLTVAVVLAVAGAVAPLLGIKKPPRSYRFLSGTLERISSFPRCRAWSARDSR